MSVGPFTTHAGEAMSIDANKTLSRRSLEMWASGNADNPDEIFAPGYLNRQEPDAAGSDTPLDLAGWKAVVRDNHTAFSDFRVAILMQIAEGDRVATHWRFTATQTGAYLGHPPSGRRASWTGVQIDRFADGRIAESWVVWDMDTLFRQLGLPE